jgi:hypothetical protein
MTYNTVLEAIQNALSLRPSGTKVQVADHEDAEIAILDYIEQQRPRKAHASATSDVNCELTWDAAFTDTNYSFVVNGFDALGNPCQITLISKTATKITIQTFVDATIHAIANSY